MSEDPNGESVSRVVFVGCFRLEELVFDKPGLGSLDTMIDIERV